ncbi:MAG: YfbK domain-containing protein [Planctomycetota bacterium]
MEHSLPLRGDALATVRVRWKSPEGDEVQEIEQGIDGSAFTGWDGASAGMQRSVLAARFAEVLRRSKHAKLIDLEDLAQAAERLSAQQSDPDLKELSELIRLAQPLIAALPEPDAELEPLFEALRDNALRKARYQIDHPEVVQQVEGTPSKLPSDDDPAWIDLGRERQDLEQRVTEVLRKRLEAAGER